MDENKLKAEKKLRRRLTNCYLCYDEKIEKHIIIETMSAVSCKNIINRYYPYVNYIGQISRNVAWELYQTYNFQWVVNEYLGIKEMNFRCLKTN